MANLHFIETRTVEQFKDDTKVAEIEVKQSPATSKLFFTYGANTGAVAANGIPQHPMFSLVHPELDREPTDEERRYIGKTVMLNGKRVAHPGANGYFYLLHEEGHGSAPVLAKF